MRGSKNGIRTDRVRYRDIMGTTFTIAPLLPMKNIGDTLDDLTTRIGRRNQSGHWLKTIPVGAQ